MSKIKRIVHNGELLAIILPGDFSPEGIEFVTDPENSIQLAAMQHQAGHCIQPHRHNAIKRTVLYTQEVLVVRRGRVRVDLYTSAMEYIESHNLAAGDVILLVQGGHGFEVIEDLDMVEIKQGPFIGEKDKTRFVSFRDFIKLVD